MGKESLASEAEGMQEEDEDLSFILYELNEAERHIQKCYEADTKVDKPYLLLMLRATEEKLQYYEKKYDIKIPGSDIFFLENLMDFVRAKDKMMAESEAAEAN